MIKELSFWRFVLCEQFRRHKYRTRMVVSDVFNDSGEYLTQCDRCGAIQGGLVHVQNHRS